MQDVSPVPQSSFSYITAQLHEYLNSERFYCFPCTSDCFGRSASTFRSKENITGVPNFITVARNYKPKLLFLFCCCSFLKLVLGAKKCSSDCKSSAERENCG